MDYFKLGQITAPVGIKGEIRVYSYLDELTRFSDVKKVLVEGEDTYRDLEKYRVDKNMVVIKLAGIDDRNTSELYRNKYLLLPKEEMPKLPQNTYYYEEIAGLVVFDESGNKIGVVENIKHNGRQDLYEINTGEKTFSLPAVKEFVLDIDVENKKMTVHLIDGLMDL